MKLVPSCHRRQLREQRGAQRRQPDELPAEEGVFGQGDGERGSRGGLGGCVGCAAATCCLLRIFYLFVNNQSCFLWKNNDNTCPEVQFLDQRFSSLLFTVTSTNGYLLLPPPPPPEQKWFGTGL
jgi:hypothetical protein